MLVVATISVYVVITLCLAGVTTVATTDMWLSGDRPAAIVFGSVFGGITLLLVFGPLI